MTAIFAKGLSKYYGEIKALCGLDLEVRRGELFSLLGLNGAGKSTAIKLLTCLTEPSGGDALVLGKSVTREAESVKRKIGVSPQETALAEGLSVRENLAMMAGVFGLSKGEGRERIESLARRLSLDAVLDRRAGKLSGGWKRRVSIAMALVGDPEVLFLDEPTLGLDVLARRELWKVISDIRGKCTVLLTTHYMEEAESLSDRVGILDGGRMLAVGTPSELMASCNAKSLEEAFVRLVGGDRR